MLWVVFIPNFIIQFHTYTSILRVPHVCSSFEIFVISLIKELRNVKGDREKVTQEQEHSSRLGYLVRFTIKVFLPEWKSLQIATVDLNEEVTNKAHCNSLSTFSQCLQNLRWQTSNPEVFLWRNFQVKLGTTIIRASWLVDSRCSGTFTARAFLGILGELVSRQEPEEDSPRPHQCLPVLYPRTLTYKILALTASNWLRNQNQIEHVIEWGEDLG